MPRRPWIWLGILASGAALLAAGHAAGSTAQAGKSSCLALIPFNSSRPLFRGNPALRRAVNWVIDRADYVAGGPGVQTPWTHLLPPNAPGSITNVGLQPYARRANIARARRIAGGHFRDGGISVYYGISGTTDPSVRVQNVRRDLINLGFDPANITMRGFRGFAFYDEISKENSAWDLAVSIGECKEDPAAFMPQSWPWYYPQNQKYIRRMRAVTRLTGRARSRALGKLDLEITRNVAPVAVMGFSSES